MLFKIVPDLFFSPLASPGKKVYWEVIVRLYEIMNNQLSFGVERDILVDELQVYFSSKMAADFMDEDFKDTEPMGYRDKANFVLRKLESYGWIYIDVDYSYVQRVNFNDYAVTIIKALLTVSEEKKTEYQGYIYTIYNLAKAGGNNQGLGLLQMMENMDALLTGLKSLNANIKRYIDNLTKHSTVAEILDALLNDYYSNIVDKAYHRLLTSDNIAKFRPEILERLEACSRSTRFINGAAREIAELREITEEEAKETVLEMLHLLITALHRLDDILEEINKKNMKYQRAAINRARFLMSSSEDIRGQLKDILGYLGEQIHEKSLDDDGIYEMEEIDQLIRIYGWDYLDKDSLYVPTEGKKEFIPAEIDDFVPDEKQREEKRMQMRRKLDQILNPKKIMQYVEEQLQGRMEMKASELPVEVGDTFMRLIYIRLYGQRKNMGYRLEMQDYIEKGGFRFRDFKIIKKQ